MTTIDLTRKDAIKQWLLGYAWYGTPAERAAMVDCIMAQDDWRHISTVADQFAGAQFESAPAAVAEDEQFALSALYECHSGPHLPGCPVRF